MYEATDKGILALNKYFIKIFDKYNRITAFDELNDASSGQISDAIESIKNDYKKMVRTAEDQFLELALIYYDEFSETEKTDINRKWVKNFLSEYNPVTKYQFYNEAERKAERFAESLIATNGNRQEIKTALRYWAVQVSQYALDITDRAVLQAYKDNGTKQVKWFTQIDEKVCDICKKRNGKIYDIDKIPDKPHLNCRCYYKPIDNR